MKKLLFITILTGCSTYPQQQIWYTNDGNGGYKKVEVEIPTPDKSSNTTYNFGPPTVTLQDYVNSLQEKEEKINKLIDDGITKALELVEMLKSMKTKETK